MLFRSEFRHFFSFFFLIIIKTETRASTAITDSEPWRRVGITASPTLTTTETFILYQFAFTASKVKVKKSNLSPPRPFDTEEPIVWLLFQFSNTAGSSRPRPPQPAPVQRQTKVSYSLAATPTPRIETYRRVSPRRLFQLPYHYRSTGLHQSIISFTVANLFLSQFRHVCVFVFSLFFSRC